MLICHWHVFGEVSIQICCPLKILFSFCSGPPALLPFSLCPLDIWLLNTSCFSVSCVLLFAIPWTAAYQAPLFFTISRSLLKFISVKTVMLSIYLIRCHPLLLLPSIFPSIRVFSSVLAFCIRWPKYWSFIFSVSLFSEYSGLIFFRMDWFDLLAVQGTLQSLLQHHSLKASVLQYSAFFMI